MLALTALGAAALASGCGTPPGQFVIIQNQVPQNGCEIPATVGSLYRDSGDLDVSLVFDNADTAYLFFPLMQNNLPPSTGGGDPNRIALSSYEVDLGLPADAPHDAIWNLFQTLATDTDQGPDPLIKYSIPTSGSVASGGGDTAGFVAAVPAGLARMMRDTQELRPAGTFVYVMATVRAQGQTLTSTVTSDPFHYPIRVCDGCLANDLGACPLKQASSNAGDPCNVSQDETIDCCDLGTELVCPPVVSSQ